MALVSPTGNKPKEFQAPTATAGPLKDTGQTTTKPKSYTSQQIANMTPAQRSELWHGADPSSQEALHAANVADLSGSHTYDEGTGSWTAKASAPSTYGVNIGDTTNNYSTPYLRSVRDMATLFDNYTYDEKSIRQLFDNATRAEYAKKRRDNETAQREYAKLAGGVTISLAETMRQQLNQAIATGGSRGTAAAQAMQAAMGASQQTVDEATKLVEDRLNLDYEEAAALAQNAKDAEALSAKRQEGLVDLGASLFGVDSTTTQSAITAAANWAAGRDYNLGASVNNLEGTKYNADSNKATELGVADINAQNNVRSILANLLQNGNIDESAFDELAAMFNLEEGSLKETPVKPTYSGGYSGGYSSGGYSNSGYTGGGYTGSTYTGNNSNTDGAYGTVKTTVKTANADMLAGLANENLNQFVAAQTSVGIPYDVAVQNYYANKNDKLIANAKSMSKAEYTNWFTKYIGSAAQAEHYWNKTNPSKVLDATLNPNIRGTDKNEKKNFTGANIIDKPKGKGFK